MALVLILVPTMAAPFTFLLQPPRLASTCGLGLLLGGLPAGRGAVAASGLPVTGGAERLAGPRGRVVLWDVALQLLCRL